VYVFVAMIPTTSKINPNTNTHISLIANTANTHSYTFSTVTHSFSTWLFSVVVRVGYIVRALVLLHHFFKFMNAWCLYCINIAVVVAAVCDARYD